LLKNTANISEANDTKVLRLRLSFQADTLTILEALKPEHVIQMMNGGRVLFPFLAANLGCSNVHCADFRVESWIVSEHGFDDYDPEIDRDFYFLIATEK
jgi:hypothetical protein